MAQIAQAAQASAQTAQQALETMRNPPLTEKQKADVEQEQQMRLSQAKLVLAEMENKRRTQRMCTHKHPLRDGGGSHCVYIVDGNYILCQKCQGKIRPEAAPEGYKGGDIYDVNLFNMLLQDLGTGAEIIA